MSVTRFALVRTRVGESESSNELSLRSSGCWLKSPSSSPSRTREAASLTSTHTLDAPVRRRSRDVGRVRRKCAAPPRLAAPPPARLCGCPTPRCDAETSKSEYNSTSHSFVRSQADRPALAPADCSARTTHVPRCDSTPLKPDLASHAKASPKFQTDPNPCIDPWAKREAWRKVCPPPSFLASLDPNVLTPPSSRRL